MKKLLLVLIVGILLVGIIGGVYAKKDVDSSANSDSASASSNSDSSDGSATNKGQAKKIASDSDDSSSSSESYSGGKIKETQSITLMDENQNQYQVTVRVETKERDGEEQVKIKVRDVEISSDVEVEQDGNLLKAKLSNGNKQDIKIMPDTASQTAIDKLETKGLNVQLKEVGEGNNLSVVYEAEGNKTVKFLGLFKVRAQVRAMISAENGEVLKLEKPWWYFLAFGKGAVDCDADNLDLCDDADECGEAGLIWYNNSCVVSCPEDEFICDDGETIAYRSESLNCEFDISVCPVCDADNLDLCLDELSCTNATGYWYNDSCNSEPEIVLVCGVDNLDLCLNETDCILFNGTWDSNATICA